MKLLFCDVETTGLNSKEHSIWSLSYLLVEDNKILSKDDYHIRPYKNAEPKALEMSGMTLDEMQVFPTHKEVFEKFSSFLDSTVSKFDKQDKLLFVGYNSKFDEEFVRQWFEDNGDKYYGSYFWSGTVDVMSMCNYALQSIRHKLPDFKLKTLAKLFNVELEEHTSSSDIMATFEIYQELNKNIIPINL